MPGRGWIPIENDKRWDNEDYFETVMTECNVLALAWSRITTQSEQDMWHRRSDEDQYRNYDPEEEALYALADEQQNLKDELERVQLEHIENRLNEIGARMMRPYEHHNEMEGYIAYMERDR